MKYIKTFEKKTELKIGYYVKIPSQPYIYKICDPGINMDRYDWYIVDINDQNHYHYINGDELKFVAKNEEELELKMALKKYNL